MTCEVSIYVPPYINIFIYLIFHSIRRNNFENTVSTFISLLELNSISMCKYV